MTATPLQIAVHVFDGVVSRAQPAALTVSAVGVWLNGELLVPARLRQITEPIGTSPWLFELDDGRLIEVPAAMGSAAAMQWGHRRSRLGRWERSLRLALLSVPALLLAGYLAVEVGVPFLADRAASMVPPTAETMLGRRTIDLLDRSGAATTLPLERQARLRQGFAAMARQLLPPGTLARLEFRDIPDLRANAFALPGGTVLATDDLVRQLNDPEVLAVLAHELGHVRNHHVVRMIFRSSGLAILAATMVGDASTVGALLTGAPVLVLQLGFSRQFESEADDVAFRWLRRPGGNPCDFATALVKIEAYDLGGAAGNPRGVGPSWLSTHPGTPERIGRFRKYCGMPV